MEKLNIYLYPNAGTHVHDTMPKYINAVPLSQQGISQHCNLVSADKADYFYMGQFSYPNFPNLKSFEYFEQYKDKHILDLEGDGGFLIPSELHSSIITTIGTLRQYNNLRIFTRPTFSYLLLDLKNQVPDNSLSRAKQFCFKGFINCRTRQVLNEIFTSYLRDGETLNFDFSTNPNWNGPTDANTPVRNSYVSLLKGSTLSLCPRGSGVDSVRVLESCFFGAIPIIITDRDYILPGEYKYDTSFIYKIVSPDNDIFYILSELYKIWDNAIDKELEVRREAGQKYFIDIINNYLNDPTLDFIKWLKNGT